MGAAYITPAEYKAAPTSVDWLNLNVDSALYADQDAELVRVIARASAWCDNYVNQDIVGAVRWETRRRRISRAGTVTLSVPHWPVRQLLTLSTGTDASNLVAVPAATIAAAWIERGLIVVPVNTAATGLGLRTAGRFLTRCSYTHGWSATTLTAATAVGATTLQVKDATSIFSTAQIVSLALDSGLSTITLADGAQTETVTVTNVTGTTVTVSACTYAHGSGVGVSNLPAELKQAAILVTTAMIQTRGDAAIDMSQSLQPGPIGAVDPVANANLRLAREILAGYGMFR
jgi:hypothetical protein